MSTYMPLIPAFFELITARLQINAMSPRKITEGPSGSGSLRCIFGALFLTRPAVWEFEIANQFVSMTQVDEYRPLVLLSLSQATMGGSLPKRVVESGRSKKSAPRGSTARRKQPK
jgi:hypothetical protein